MGYQTRIIGGVVQVTSSRSGVVRDYQIPAGATPAVYALRCAERARVSECLAAIADVGRKRSRRQRRAPQGDA